MSAVNHIHETGWITYWTAAGSRGRGVASEATVQVANWSIASLGLFRLELGHRTNIRHPAWSPTRLASGRGLERAKLRYGDRRYDIELHARLATDDPTILLKLA